MRTTNNYAGHEDLTVNDLERLEKAGFEVGECTFQVAHEGMYTYARVKRLLELKYGVKITEDQMGQILSVVLKDIKVQKGKKGYGYTGIKMKQLNEKGKENPL